ncbi:hypothetical protein D7Y13_30685 [Corallococcus praedator]|uniref:Uncharacterized protein n=2 Tax=Myxococcaceae TaxID=31 RepID=A0ABX9QAE2_9BACT|nr:hypothetical protein D7X75_19520 [Corallococcus sp. CA031C]RKH96768.1 hypothetical protein D7Y13_30685 [Corallococcus praedator]
MLAVQQVDEVGGRMDPSGMTGDWNMWIRQALEGPEGEPFLRLLKERLRSGSQVVGVRLESPGGAPEYVITLSLLKQLSEMRVPHSEAFTVWSFDTGTRMVDERQELERFVLLLSERFAALAREAGPDVLASALVNYLPVLGPPRASEEARRRMGARGMNNATLRAITKLEAVLMDAARSLGRSLKYDEATTGRILDGALAQWLSRKPRPLDRDVPNPSAP